MLSLFLWRVWQWKRRGNEHKNLRRKKSHRDRSEDQNHKAPTLWEVDSGHLCTTSSSTTRYGTYSCVCVCVHINKSVCDRRKIYPSSQRLQIMCQVMNLASTSRTSSKYVRTRHLIGWRYERHRSTRGTYYGVRYDVASEELYRRHEKNQYYPSNQPWCLQTTLNSLLWWFLNNMMVIEFFGYLGSTVHDANGWEISLSVVGRERHILWCSRERERESVCVCGHRHTAPYGHILRDKLSHSRRWWKYKQDHCESVLPLRNSISPSREKSIPSTKSTLMPSKPF